MHSVTVSWRLYITAFNRYFRRPRPRKHSPGLDNTGYPDYSRCSCLSLAPTLRSLTAYRQVTRPNFGTACPTPISNTCSPYAYSTAESGRGCCCRSSLLVLPSTVPYLPILTATVFHARHHGTFPNTQLFIRGDPTRPAGTYW